MRFKKMLGSVVDENSFRQWIIALSDWEYEIINVEEKRSDKQNRYLRGCVYRVLADYTGYDKDKVHAIMSYKFLLDQSGKSPYVKSTALLSPKEFTEYVDKIIDFAASFGVAIPSAESYDKVLNSNRY